MSGLLALLPLEFTPSIPGLLVTEPKSVLDENLARIAFAAAERELSARGFSEMDGMCDLPEHAL